MINNNILSNKKKKCSRRVFWLLQKGIIFPPTFALFAFHLIHDKEQSNGERQCMVRAAMFDQKVTRAEH